MEIWQAVILGIVEGITEYLPVSSTGHLILASALMGLDDPASKAAVDAFNIVIQGGAILAVLGLYWARVAQMLRGAAGLVRIGRGDPAGVRLAVNLFIAFLPAAVLGVLLKDIIEHYLFHAGPVLLALALGGVYMILLERWRVRRDHGAWHDDGPSLDSITPVKALVIGLMQCIAMWPGTSRSMMTITAGVVVGLKPKQAAEFSFLLGLPTLGGACLFTLYKTLSDDGDRNMLTTLGWAPIVVGLIVATISAALAVKWLVSFLTRHGLTIFGWYRLGLCVVLGVLVLGGIVRIGENDGAPSGKFPESSVLLDTEP